MSQFRKRIALTLLAALFLLPSAAMALDKLQNTDPDKYYIELDTAAQVVTVYQKDDDGEYTRIVRRFICTSGKTEPNGDEPASPTPSGTWKIGARERFGHFAAFRGEYARYWTQVVGGVYFHSVMFNSRDFDDLQKGAYGRLGSRASHGCIRLYVEDAKWLYYNACFGTTVNVVSRKPNAKLVSALKSDMSYADYRDFQANIYDEEPLPDSTAWVVSNDAQLRTGNGTNDKFIKHLSKGDELTVIQEGDPWAKVQVDGHEGYVRRCFITYEKGLMQSTPNGFYVAGTQYLYAEPNTRAERIYKVARHSTIRVLEDNVGEDGKWMKINYWGTEGYIQRRYVKTGWATLYND